MSKEVSEYDINRSGEMINFGIGRPSSNLLPLDLLQQASEAFFRGAEPHDITYGRREGDERFTESLAAFLEENYGQRVQPDSLFLSGKIPSPIIYFLRYCFLQVRDY